MALLSTHAQSSLQLAMYIGAWVRLLVVANDLCECSLFCGLEAGGPHKCPPILKILGSLLFGLESGAPRDP